MRLTLLILCTALAGCATPPVQSLPPGWPAVWEGRTLTRTRDAWVYAASPNGATDAQRAAAGAASGFREIADRAPPEVLIIVVDVGERAPPNSRFAAAAATVEMKTSDDPGMTAEQRQLAQGILVDVLACAPVSMVGDEKSALTTLPTTVREHAPAIITMPTDRLVSDTVVRMFDNMMKQSKASFAERLATGPILVFAKGAMKDELRRAPRFALLQAWAAADHELTVEQRQKLLDAVQRQMTAPALRSGTVIELRTK